MEKGKGSKKNYEGTYSEGNILAESECHGIPRTESREYVLWGDIKTCSLSCQGVS